MPANQNRPDRNGWAKATYLKARKKIFASQSVCAICGRPVNFDLKFPDPWSATVDHIVPISKGGNPADIANMQAKQDEIWEAVKEITARLASIR